MTFDTVAPTEKPMDPYPPAPPTAAADGTLPTRRPTIEPLPPLEPVADLGRHRSQRPGRHRRPGWLRRAVGADH